ncbi:hypothetical protein O1611_g6323 [Lasiodiplodia mahajangana]|uniref:Uncharacterized protein n=1 Tax=Lasiodiplodia mahajangana TaxID=1108764 RepID=A0ACC2JJE1_9PEZI|nr:hypothetical protein O1611_g6323 [Lasiodiplodia mahajangana]
MARLHGLTSSTSRAGVFGPPARPTTGSLLRRSPGIAVDKTKTGRCSANLTLIHSHYRYPSPGRTARTYHARHCNQSNQSQCQSQQHSSNQHLSEPCSSHPGLFSSSPLARKWEPPAHTSAHIPPAATGQISATSLSRRRSTGSSTLLRPPPTAGVFRRRPAQPMAYNTYSTAGSDISTPRSTSPSSVFSGRSSHTSVASKRLSLSLQRRQSAFNPMSTVDIASIEQRMKMASLDGLRGYAQDHYGEVKQYRTTDYVPKSAAGGYQVLREPLWNKGVHLLNPDESLLPNPLRASVALVWSVLLTSFP